MSGELLNLTDFSMISFLSMTIILLVEVVMIKRSLPALKLKAASTDSSSCNRAGEERVETSTLQDLYCEHR